MEKSYTFFIMIFFVSFLLAAIATPVVSRIAFKNEIIDKPGLHKTHYKPKPLLGGLAIFLGFAATLLFFLDLDDKLLPMVTATVILVITGLFDDIYNIKPLLKLFGQTIAASVVVLWNIHLYKIMLEYFGRLNVPEIVVLILIIGWIVLMINAFNLIDGLDGLAVGTAAIIFLAMAIISLITDSTTNMLGVQLIGLGACLGFLIFNFNPAKIFMGDTGSMLLGFILAATHLFTIKYPFSAQVVLGSIFIFAYPALDISYAIYRRIYHRSSIFQADKKHIHHVLLSLGFSVRKTVLLIYLANIILAAIAVLFLSLNISTRTLVVISILTAIAVIVFFWRLIIISERNGLVD